jgi:hypothetical protein
MYGSKLKCSASPSLERLKLSDDDAVEEKYLRLFRFSTDGGLVMVSSSLDALQITT